MEVLKFFNENKKSTYEYIKDILEQKYKLELRIDKSNNYFMISTTNESDFNNLFIRQCSGIIIEKETYNVLHYFGEIAYDINNNYNNNKVEIENINIEKCFISRYIDGYMIKIFNYNKKWKFATSNHTNIEKYRIKDRNTTLYGIFKKCILNTFDSFDDFLNFLDCKYCYSFILNDNNLHMINKIHINKLNEHYNFNSFKSFIYINDVINNKSEKYLIVEKDDKKIHKKIHASINDIEKLISENKICLYNNKCVNKYCKLNHMIKPNIEDNYKEYINFKRKTNPLFKTKNCRNGDNCPKNIENKCIFIHNNNIINN